MTNGKATAWILGLVGVIALGFWVAPTIADRASSPTTASETATPVLEEPIAEPAKPARTKPMTTGRDAPAAATSTAKAEVDCRSSRPKYPSCSIVCSRSSTRERT